DVIFCRNVLIYFDGEATAHVAAQLLASLSHDGYLFLGASDPPLSELVDCEVTQTPGGLVYRRASNDRPRRRVVARTHAALIPPPVPPVPPLAAASDAPSASPAAPKSAPIGFRRAADAIAGAGGDEQTLSAERQLHDAFDRRDYALAAELGQAMLAAGNDNADAMRLTVESLANVGRLRDAERHCALALDRHGDVAPLRLLMATLLLQSGHERAAATEARRAIYLDRTLGEGYVVLADALIKLGDARAARRTLLRAERALPAGQLRAMARARLAQLSENADE
ncbi:MAG TPA: CheR family methyltransferase, partial [Gemmatimonadaceae bacterium]|nr:CheR family methyltransferase [Gemmatimonadaceae bacterium]